jgi:Kae1-associated kinase Bud32
MTKPISEGAESRIYPTEIFGIDAIAKVRGPKAYRVPLLDVSIRSTRTKKEAKIMALALSHGVRVPRLLGVSDYSIYMEKIHGNLMKDAKISGKQAEMAGTLLATLHNAGIVHGDFTPANILIGEDGKLYLIDFGLSEISHGAEGRALDLLLIKRQMGVRLYTKFVKNYSQGVPSAREIIKRLAEIEKRGRYQTRTLG